MRRLLLVVAVLLLGACSSGSDVSEGDLDGRRFVGDGHLPAELSFADGQLTLTDCSTSMGPYLVEGGRLRFADAPFTATSSRCLEDNDREATPGLDQLGEAGLAVQLDGDVLTLTGTGTEVRLVERS